MTNCQLIYPNITFYFRRRRGKGGKFSPTSKYVHKGSAPVKKKLAPPVKKKPAHATADAKSPMAMETAEVSIELKADDSKVDEEDADQCLTYENTAFLGKYTNDSINGFN